jgi:hypothetical protein
MTTADFIDLVRRLRSMQRLYFKDRDGDILNICRKLEAETDRALAEMDKPTLFPEEEKGPYQ